MQNNMKERYRMQQICRHPRPLSMKCNNLGDPLTSHLALSSGQNFNFFNINLFTLVYDQIAAKLIPFSLSCILGLVLIRKCCCYLTND